MNTRVHLLVVAVTLLASLHIASGQASDQPVTLAVGYYPQLASYWCWAAGAQMLMTYAGASPPEQISQCEQANKRFSTTDCCHPGRPPVYCNAGSEPQFEPFGFAASTAATFTEAEVKAQLQERREPFIFRWDYEDDLRHFAIAIGTSYLNGELYLVVLDPHPSPVMVGPFLSYDAFLKGSGYKLGEVIYGLHKKP